jgi:hypothetical protein
MSILPIVNVFVNRYYKRHQAEKRRAPKFCVGLPEYEELYPGVEDEFESIVPIPINYILELQFKI